MMKKKILKMKRKSAPKDQTVTDTTIRLDLGCGPNKAPGFIGIDRIAFPGVDRVLEMGKDRWPFEDGSVDEARASHSVEHLTVPERIHFVNELYRVLKPGAGCLVVTPHWNSSRAYGDLTHQWPPVCEFWFYYLSKTWRALNAPHNDFYTCDFEVSWGYSLRDDLTSRNAEFQQMALQNYKDAAQDIIATLKKR